MNEPISHSVTWAWSDPLAAILEYGGWSVDDVLASPETARQFDFLWQLLKQSGADSRRIRERREAFNAAAEERWWRDQI